MSLSSSSRPSCSRRADRPLRRAVARAATAGRRRPVQAALRSAVRLQPRSPARAGRVVGRQELVPEGAELEPAAGLRAGWPPVPPGPPPAGLRTVRRSESGRRRTSVASVPPAFRRRRRAPQTAAGDSGACEQRSAAARSASGRRGRGRRSGPRVASTAGRRRRAWPRRPAGRRWRPVARPALDARLVGPGAGRRRRRRRSAAGADRPTAGWPAPRDARSTRRRRGRSRRPVEQVEEGVHGGVGLGRQRAPAAAGPGRRRRWRRWCATCPSPARPR